MPGDIPVEDVEKYQKYATYLLVDIKILFIVTYVYISVVNLISTTANNEATQDVENPVRYNLTSKPEHTNVIVKYVDDAILWKCREYSLTDNYYKTMYLMLLAMLIITLVLYGFSKGFALCKNHPESLNDLWHLGILKLLIMQKKAYLVETKAEETAKYIQGLLDDDISKNEITQLPKFNRLVQRIVPYMSFIASIFLLVSCILSYDLHSLSCISGIPEDSINYDNTTYTVELRFPEDVIRIQWACVFIASILLIAFLSFVGFFYCNNSYIIDEMKEIARNKIQNKCQIDLVRDHNAYDDNTMATAC